MLPKSRLKSNIRRRRSDISVSTVSAGDMGASVETNTLRFVISIYWDGPCKWSQQHVIVQRAEIVFQPSCTWSGYTAVNRHTLIFELILGRFVPLGCYAAREPS